MAPKRKAAVAAEEKAKKAKPTATVQAGLVVGGDFPYLGPLLNEEEKQVELKVRPLAVSSRNGWVQYPVSHAMLGHCVQEVLDSKGIIIFFYPRANTPGCTTQACGLSEAFPDITAAGFELFGMSADKPKPQATWKVTMTG